MTNPTSPRRAWMLTGARAVAYCLPAASQGLQRGAIGVSGLLSIPVGWWCDRFDAAICGRDRVVAVMGRASSGGRCVYSADAPAAQSTARARLRHRKAEWSSKVSFALGRTACSGGYDLHICASYPLCAAPGRITRQMWLPTQRIRFRFHVTMRQKAGDAPRGGSDGQHSRTSESRHHEFRSASEGAVRERNPRGLALPAVVPAP
jgi:hypothetical protein